MEAVRSPSGPRVHLVNPRHENVLGRRCLPSLAEVPETVDLVLLGVPDAALPEQVALAAERGDAAAVVFGAARSVESEVAATARGCGLALAGPGCMGFVNVAKGMRAVGYLERESLAAGPIALVTQSGSVFSAMLRTHRRLEYALAVSSGRELVTSTADYLGYALDLPEARVVGLFLETMTDVPALRAVLERAARDDVTVVALTTGSSPLGKAMVGTHSGALAGHDAAWEALFGAYGVHRVGDLDELVETLEVFAIGRRVRRRSGDRQRGIATVHDSGGQRALTADLAHAAGVPFAEIGAATSDRLAAVLEEGMSPANPLDVWGTGADTQPLFTECLAALAEDEAVDVTALVVDLVEEYDGDDSYPLAVQQVHASCDAPVVVLSTLGAAVDQVWAGRLRAVGVPVLEGLSTGLRALGHLLDASKPVRLPEQSPVDEARRARWRARLDAGSAVVSPAGVGAGSVDGSMTGSISGAELFDLLADYGIDVVRTRWAGSAAEVVVAADRLGYPLVLKTAATGVDHKVDVAGVVVDLRDERALSAAYTEMAARLGPNVRLQPMVVAGVELALGIVRDPDLGPLVLLAAGGTLVELVAQRAVVLPPTDLERATYLLDEVPLIGALLDGVRGQDAADRSAVAAAVVGLAQMAHELGDRLDALDLNPLICGSKRAVAVDALLVARIIPGASP